jgi:hypothetical protein
VSQPPDFDPDAHPGDPWAIPAPPPSASDPTAPYPTAYPTPYDGQQQYYGQQPAYGPPPSYVPPPSYYALSGATPVTNGLAITSLVVGIVSLVLSFCCVGLSLLGVAGVICGFVARSQIARSQGYQTGAGLALAGIVVSSIAVLLGVGLFVLTFAVMAGSG